MCLEIYEVDEAKKTLKLREELQLYKDEQRQNPFTGSRRKEGYMKKGSIVCNGQVLIWHSNHNWHVFDCSTGVRIRKDHMNSTALVSAYDAKENWYYHMDAACYSWLKKWRVSGFKPRVLTKVVKEHPDLPPVLDSIKGDILLFLTEEQKAKDEAQKKSEENKEVQ